MKKSSILMAAALLAVSMAREAGASDIASAAARSRTQQLARARKVLPKSTETRSTAKSRIVEAPIPQPCNWWVHFERCDGSVEGLPPEAPKEGVIITVDTRKNVAYMFRDGAMVSHAPAATGMDKWLEHGEQKWLFRTPRGRHTILRKIVDPVWTKPDWAFVEEGKPIPSPTAPERRVKGKLGRYALDLGDGILIHGTDQPSSLGRKASHGCIRLGDSMLERLFTETEVGTEVWIF